MGAAGEGRDAGPCRRIERGTAGDEQKGIEVALDADLRLDLRRRPGGIDRGVKGNAVDAGGIGESGVVAARPAGKADHRHGGMRRADRRNDVSDRVDAVAREERPGQRAGPAVEELDGFGPGLDLALQVEDGRLGDPVDQRVEGRRVAVDQHACRRLIGRALAGDHVGRHRPGGAGEADQRGFRRQGLGHPRHGFVDGRERLVDRVGRFQPGEIRRSRHGGKPRPLAFDEAQIRAEGLGHQQDVGEEDRRVEVVAADRLQRHLGGEIGGVAEIEEAASRCPDLAILRQIPAGLAHHPDRRNRQPLAGQRTQQGFGLASCHACSIIVARDLATTPVRRGLSLR